jgi:hypothetical protein
MPNISDSLLTVEIERCGLPPFVQNTHKRVGHPGFCDSSYAMNKGGSGPE